jgi:hypothetical protein
MIKLELVPPGIVFVNPAHITEVQDVEGGSLVWTAYGKCYKTSAKAEAVMADMTAPAPAPMPAIVEKKAKGARADKVAYD